MTEQVSPLATFYKPGWENYQQAIVKTIAPLTPEQLTLSFGPDQRSIGALLDHMIGARFYWFHIWMGEGDPNFDWNDDEDNGEPTAYKAASLVAMFEKSWRELLDRVDPLLVLRALERVFDPRPTLLGREAREEQSANLVELGRAPFRGISHSRTLLLRPGAGIGPSPHRSRTFSDS